MIWPAVALDAEMTAAAVLERLAAQGFWAAPNHPAALQRLAPLAARTGRTIDALVQRLAHSPDQHGAAIRRQWGTRVLWYAFPLREVLDRCAAAPSEWPLMDVLNLRESGSQPVIPLPGDGATVLRRGVVMDDGRPVGVSLVPAPQGRPVPPAIPFPVGQGAQRASRGASGAEATAAATAPAVVPAWPRIEAPAMVPAARAFDVVVGFGAAKQAGVVGGQVMIPAPQGVSEVRLTVELSAGAALQALDGWSRPLTVRLNDVTAASVTFRLIGIEPPDQPALTMLEVRYVLDGTVCGTAAKPIVVLASGSDEVPTPPDPDPTLPGEEWLSAPAPATPVVLVADEFAPDLTIEITKPDRNAASGAYTCQLLSPHPLATARGPFPMDLGQDAKTYAKSIVEEVRLFAGNDLLDNTLEAIGRTVAQCLPRAVFDALAEVAAHVAPATPAVLIVSAEPFVPWELAWVEPPLDAARPRYLGAQAVLGRWLRDADATAGAGAVPRPATHPVSQLTVRNMAVMAAWYKAESGLRRLAEAELEAKALVQQYDGVALAATAQAMRQLLNATLERNFETIGAPQAVHFAGHGDFDPGRPEGSALFLQDGVPLRSTLFRSAKYGGERQPLLFLNACMLGIGGELLGDMAGFPGNSLRGGFGAVLGALWEVDDHEAHAIALEFWQRALPPAPARGEPIGKILQDLRAKYVPAAPVSTYLSYVYYGHPRLHLQRAATAAAAVGGAD